MAEPSGTHRRGLLLPLIALTVLQAPVVLLLALVPLAFIIPVLLWLDRLEPEPWTSRLHTFLWGGTIAVLVSGTFNVAVLLAVGEAASAVISAPIVEESMKGLGILWAVRRREVDGPVDGVLAETSWRSSCPPSSWWFSSGGPSVVPI